MASAQVIDAAVIFLTVARREFNLSLNLVY